ncbi:ribonuclease H-like domain-containing protein [Tanacetum coccineum]
MEKPFGVTNIKSHVSLVLDLDQLNYDAWCELFTSHCHSFGVQGLLDGTFVCTSDNATEWKKLDSLVKVWIYSTISTSLLQTVLKKNVTTQNVWKSLADLFHDNKEARAMELHEELRSLELGTLSIAEYFKRIKVVSDLLSNIESPVDDKNLVMYAVNGLGDKYDHVASIIRHSKNPLTLLETRSMLLLEESRLNRKQGRGQARDTPSSSTVLMASGSGNSNKGATNKEICKKFQRGHCRFGDRCKYVHHRVSHSGKLSQWNAQNRPHMQQEFRGSQVPLRATGTRPQWAGNYTYTSGGNYTFTPGPSPTPGPTGSILGPAPQPPVHSAYGPTGPRPGASHGYWEYGPSGNVYVDQPTTIPHAFNATTLRYADNNEDSGWYMDTGATSHLSSDAGNLTTIFNKRINTSIVVGNGATIPVTNSGHSILPSLHRPLYLQNVLVTPHIIKNLISVRQFTRDNKCTIEFDEFGFLVKITGTRSFYFLRCDSTPDHNPRVTSSTTTTPTALFSSNQSTWHQRLGHPGDDVLRFLVFNKFISCNKTKSTTLCHACQLGKHVRHPFLHSSTIVENTFDIVHSDVWTSPIPSVSGFQYYVLFLDHYSHFLWVYPLQKKSDAFSKFLLFRAYVKTQFDKEIKSFQCDHGGEFDNTRQHDLFKTNGIQFRFSCPKTSQQNGRSERMIRTINNLIRTLLFQAHLPPQYWTEALFMATHLLNILPSTAIKNDIPFTKLFNKQPSYKHLRVFGCLCYPYIHSTHKLQPRSTPCVFLGYPTNHRGYRCLDLATNKIIISRHVNFEETIFPFGSMTPSNPPSYNFLEHNDTPSPIQLKLLTTPNSSTVNQPTSNTSQAQQQPNIMHPSTSSAHSSPQSTTSNTHVPHSILPAPSTVYSPAHQPTQQSTTTSTQPAYPPPPNPNNTSRHPMVTRSRDGTTKPTNRFTLHVSSVSPLPKSHIQASKNPHWQNAMQDEFNALIKNGTWVLVPRPPNVNVVRSMWLFKHKFNADGTLSRYKARLVANGKSQQPGVDCDETFSPVVKHATIRIVLSLVVSRQWPIHQLDVKNAFLHGHLIETVYMHQPPGFTDPIHPDYVCHLQRFLYGLKQAPRAWFQRFVTYAARVGFHHSKTDSSLLIFRKGADTAYLLLYVDDIILTASSSAFLQRIISSLHGEFAMTDLGPLNYFLVQQLCLYMHDPREPHFHTMKRVLRYLRGTIDLGLQLFRSSTSQLTAYSDAEWAGCPTTRRSTLGYCVFLGDNHLTWSSKGQKTLSRSSADAEYQGVTNVVAETSWICNLLRELHTPLSTATLVYCDNVSAVYMSANPVQHQRTKHIKIDIHFVRDKVADGHVRVLHVPSRFQYADIFTKGLPFQLFADFRSSLSVRASPAPTAGAY